MGTAGKTSLSYLTCTRKLVFAIPRTAEEKTDSKALEYVWDKEKYGLEYLPKGLENLMFRLASQY